MWTRFKQLALGLCLGLALAACTAAQTAKVQAFVTNAQQLAAVLKTDADALAKTGAAAVCTYAPALHDAFQFAAALSPTVAKDAATEANYYAQLQTDCAQPAASAAGLIGQIVGNVKAIQQLAQPAVAAPAPAAPASSAIERTVAPAA